MAGIKDVAREAGVSASTVSYVLSGKRSISAKTTDKVMAAVEKLGYTPNASARKMRGMRNQIIALSAPIRGDINQARYNAYFLRTAWAARNAGYDVMLLTGPDAVKDIRRVTQSNLADGIVLLDVEQDDERAAQSGTFFQAVRGYRLSVVARRLRLRGHRFRADGPQGRRLPVREGTPHRRVPAQQRIRLQPPFRLRRHLPRKPAGAREGARHDGHRIRALRSGQLRRAALRQHRLRAPRTARPPSSTRRTQASSARC